MIEPATRITGTVFDIQRFSIHDGPGIRTTVFLQGCPLRCVWCHNPEGLDPGPLLSFQPESCIGCGYCFRVCPNRAHTLIDGHHVLNRNVCKACGVCVEACWAGALQLVGREVDVDTVMQSVVRDKPFYESSGGGMTLSGGEPLIQTGFTRALLNAAGQEGIHCCVETCGAVPVSVFNEVMPYVDLFLFDVKDMNNRRHLENTGVPNTQILANLRYLHNRGANIRVRLPLILYFNDDSDHLDGVISLVRSLPDLCGVEIMPYHTLCLDKDRRFGRARDVALSKESVTSSRVQDWVERLTDAGIVVINAPLTTPS